MFYVPAFLRDISLIRAKVPILKFVDKVRYVCLILMVSLQ